MSRIVVVGSFDTKAGPLGRLIAKLRDLGEDPVTVDVGVFPSGADCDHPAADVALAAGHDIAELRTIGRAGAVAAMADGAARVLDRLARVDGVGAVVCMGGSNASTVFSRLVPVVPVGVPKILLGTGVASDTRGFVKGSDAILLYPIVDIEGDNSILRGMIDRAAHVAVGARNAGPIRQSDAERSVALSMYGVTTACVAQCRTLLAELGFESLVFHANGTGGRSMEELAAQSRVALVMDVSISEVVDELFGGLWPAGSDRLRGAARHAVPQVIAPGAIDMICVDPATAAAPRFQGRLMTAHNDLVTLIRTTAQENRTLGAVVAERLGDPAAPTSIMIPRRGVSALDVEGGPFFDPDATAEFVDGLRSAIAPSVSVIEADLHINDPEFARALVAEAKRCHQVAAHRREQDKGGRHGV